MIEACIPGLCMMIRDVWFLPEFSVRENWLWNEAASAVITLWHLPLSVRVWVSVCQLKLLISLTCLCLCMIFWVKMSHRLIISLLCSPKPISYLASPPLSANKKQDYPWFRLSSPAHNFRFIRGLCLFLLWRSTMLHPLLIAPSFPSISLPPLLFHTPQATHSAELVSLVCWSIL